jgi:hypothetical protein
VAALGSPHVLDAAPRAAVAVTTYSGEPVSQAAFVDWMAGE